MNVKKIESLLAQIETSDIVQVEDSPMLHSVHIQSEVDDDPENEILIINWHDAEGDEFRITFTEDNLDNANFKGNKILLNDNEGTPQIISLYQITPEVIVANWK